MTSVTENAPAKNVMPMVSWPAAGRFSLWTLLALMGCVAIAWTSITIQSAGLAPLILSSLLVGAAAGALLVLLSRLTGCGLKRSLLIASFGLGLLVAALQHLFAYQNYYYSMRTAIESDAKATLARTLNPDFGPTDFWGYMQSESQKSGYLWMWIVDALIIVIVTTGIVWWGNRRPYCDLCHRWYHVSRSGNIPLELVPKIETIAEIELPEEAIGHLYQMLHCRCGCSLAQMTISSGAVGGVSLHETIWLDEDQRTEWEKLLKKEEASATTRSHEN